jgi:hypothetical protein
MPTVVLGETSPTTDYKGSRLNVRGGAKLVRAELKQSAGASVDSNRDKPYREWTASVF